MSSSESEVAAPPAKSARRENLMGCQVLGGYIPQGDILKPTGFILIQLSLNLISGLNVTRLDTT
jgi:hypothetical protein